MKRGPRRDRRHRCDARALGDRARTEREARLALAPAGTESGVALDRLDVPMAESDRLLHFVERDVLAPAEHDLVRHQASPRPPASARAALRACASAVPTSR